MNSKSSESPGLLVNRNSLLILLPGLLWRCGRLHCPVLLSFFTSYGIKTITVSERHPVDGLNERMWCHSCFVFVGAGSWHWSISLNNTDFVMKSASSGSFLKKKEKRNSFHLFIFYFLGRIKQSWASELKKLTSDLLCAGLMRERSKLKSQTEAETETMKLCEAAG